MARKYASTVEEQRFYEAVIGKENETRLHIFLKNYEEREAAAKAAAERGQVHESRQMEVFKRKIERMSVFQPETLEACRNVVPTDYRLTKPKKFDEMVELKNIRTQYLQLLYITVILSLIFDCIQNKLNSAQSLLYFIHLFRLYILVVSASKNRRNRGPRQ